MHAVRRHILEILKERSSATVSELAEALEMAPVSVRHHLDLLQADNLICVDRHERKGSVGRPQLVYVLTDEADGYFPNNFAMLARNLVRQVKNVLTQEQVDTLFHALALDLASEFDEGALRAEAGTEAATKDRVQRVAEFLNERGYLASFEESASEEGADGSAGSFLIHKHNCPYAGVADEHSELCLMDQTLVNELMGSDCERVAHMAGQGTCCTYRISVAQTDSTPIELDADSQMVDGTETHRVNLPRRASIALVA